MCLIYQKGVKLKPSTTEEIEQFKRDWLNKTIQELTSVYGAKYSTMKGWATEFRATRGPYNTIRINKEGPVPTLRETLSQELGRLPKIKLPPLRSGPGDEEEAVLVIGDWHTGRLTISFNSQVLAERVQKLAEATQEITRLHRKAYPINKLHVFCLGDMVQGEGVRFQPLENFEFGYPSQVATFSRLCSDFLGEMLGLFAEVHFWPVAGNHGRASVSHGTTSNWDTVAYDIMSSTLKNNPRFIYHPMPLVAEQDYQVARVGEWRFLLNHGSSIPIFQSTPWYGITTRALRWKQSIPEPWDSLILGHYHSIGDIVFNTIPILMNGTAVSDDPFPRRALGMESETKHWFFGVHPRQFMTWRYLINLRKGEMRGAE